MEDLPDCARKICLNIERMLTIHFGKIVSNIVTGGGG